jgi:hypothetical protein
VVLLSVGLDGYVMKGAVLHIYLPCHTSPPKIGRRPSDHNI